MLKPPCNFNQQFCDLISQYHIPTMKTHLAQNKLHITELTILPQLAIVLMKSTLWVAGELQGEKLCF